MVINYGNSDSIILFDRFHVHSSISLSCMVSEHLL